MPEVDRPIFSIGAVARMLGLLPATIRTWETRYGLVVPERTAGRQRLYSRAQVEQLRFVKDAVDAGARPADAHRLLEDRGTGAGNGRKVRVALAAPDPRAAALARQVLERAGFEVESP